MINQLTDCSCTAYNSKHGNVLDKAKISNLLISLIKVKIFTYITVNKLQVKIGSLTLVIIVNVVWLLPRIGLWRLPTRMLKV